MDRDGGTFQYLTNHVVDYFIHPFPQPLHIQIITLIHGECTIKVYKHTYLSFYVFATISIRYYGASSPHPTSPFLYLPLHFIPPFHHISLSPHLSLSILPSTCAPYSIGPVAIATLSCYQTLLYWRETLL